MCQIDIGSKIRAFNLTPYRHHVALLAGLLKRLLCGPVLWVEDVVLVTLMKRWSCLQQAFSLLTFVSRKIQVWQAQGFIFGLKGHLGNLNLRALRCGAGWEEATRRSDPGTAGTVQADGWLPGDGQGLALGSCSHGNLACFQNNVSSQENSSQSLPLYNPQSRLKAQRASFCCGALH